MAACAGNEGAARRDRGGLHLGHRCDGVDRPVSRPENATALVTGASKGIGAAIARASPQDGWNVGVNYRSDEDGANATGEGDRGRGGKALAVHADITDGDARRSSRRSRKGLGPVLALVNNAGVTRDGLALQLSDEDWGHGDRHQPLARVPAHARRAAGHDQGALRPRREHHLGRRHEGQRRAVQLRRGQGGPHRHDQDDRRRGRAARRHRQRGRPRLHRHGHDRGAADGRDRQGDPGPSARHPGGRGPPPCGSSPPRTPATSPAPRCTSTAAFPP
jgi:hypothetical protein